MILGIIGVASNQQKKPVHGILFDVKGKSSMPKGKKIWIVVHIASGVPVQVKAYANPRSPARRERRWRNKINPEDDTVGLFAMRLE
jgi:hypothetical protein